MSVILLEITQYDCLVNDIKKLKCLLQAHFIAGRYFEGSTPTAELYIVAMKHKLTQWISTLPGINISARAVPAFNSCTKCKGSLGKIHDRRPDVQPDS